MNWYHVQAYLNRIKPVPVEKVTDAFVVIGGKRHARASGGEYYEPSYSAARAKLIEHHELLVSSAASMLAVRESDLKRARELSETESV
jgi:hypothetical protein